METRLTQVPALILKVSKNKYEKNILSIFEFLDKNCSIKDASKLKDMGENKFLIRFQNLRNKLEKIKKKIDQLDLKTYNKIVKYTNNYSTLSGYGSPILTEFDGEVVTNAWLKIWEIIYIFIEPELKKRTKKTSPKDMDIFNSFHVAEAPGTFMVAFNHFIKTKYPEIKWNWLAETKNDSSDSSRKKHDGTVTYLGDHYGIIKKNRDKWLDLENGDLLDYNTIKILIRGVETKFNKVDLYTGDAKGPMKSWDREEIDNIEINMAQCLLGLLLLKRGGIFVCKTFTFFEFQSISLIYLLTMVFDKFFIVKPATSRAQNSEIYFVGYDYLDNLSDGDKYTIHKYLKNPKCEISIFDIGVISESFLENIYEIEEKIINNQIDGLTEIFKNYDKYKNISNKRLYESIMKYKRIINYEWIRIYGMTKLDKHNKMLD